jgi:hypothetical protein
MLFPSDYKSDSHELGCSYAEAGRYEEFYSKFATSNSYMQEWWKRRRIALQKLYFSRNGV